MMPVPTRFLICMALLAAAPFCRAEKADRDKPVNLEADRATVDEINKIHVFEGNVTLIQGTLVIHADRMVVKQDAEGFQHGVATANPGKLAHFRVKREGKDEYVEGEAERIEYDAKTETAKFFNRAWVKSGEDEVRGQFILYDSLKENYSVTSGPDGSVVPGRDNRVRAVIQPKNKGRPSDEAAAGPPVKLQISPDIAHPR
jgi:lipopolysaccharide export system protein LptA